MVRIKKVVSRDNGQIKGLLILLFSVFAVSDAKKRSSVKKQLAFIALQ